MRGSTREFATDQESGIDRAARLRGRRLWIRGLARHRAAMVGTVLLSMIALASVIGPIVVQYDAERPDLERILQPPSGQHLFGTDELGRDVMTRTLSGGRVSLIVGVLAMSLALVTGILLGSLAGYFHRLDNFVMRLTDGAQAFPPIVVLIVLGSLVGTDISTVILVIGALRWMNVTRLVRASFLQLRVKEFVEAARAMGASDARIIVKHILPNSLGPIVVAGTLGIAGAILAESTLSFLGFGVQPQVPTWGNMLRSAQDQLYRAPWTAVFPGLFIFLTVTSINFLGDGLRDVLDPRRKNVNALP